EILGAMSISSIAVSAASIVAPGTGTENSCILTLDHAQPTSDVSLTLNGTPNVSLTGCGIRSNSSLDCNGHNGNATASIAAGTVSNCRNPQQRALAVPDIYWDLARNIVFRCNGGGNGGVTWDVSGPRPGGLITVSPSPSYGAEYHVCGDLTLTNSGTIPGSGPNAPTSDTIIVIEN